MPAQRDPLLRPFQLKHLTLRNRLMCTAHEPAYSEDGMPKDRYRLYHVEKAKGGIALTMIAGSAVVARLAAGLRQPARLQGRGRPLDAAAGRRLHAHGAAVMIQITHLGRRTDWNKDDWLPVLAPSPVREPAHRAFPKAAEDWDLDAHRRGLCRRRRAHAGRRAGWHRVRGLWPFARPVLVAGDQPAQRRLWRRAGQPAALHLAVLDAVRERVGAEFIVGIRMVGDEDWDRGLRARRARDRASPGGRGRSTSSTSSAATSTPTRRCARDPGPWACASAPHLDFAGEVRAATRFPVFHAARIQDVATARHAIAEGKLDMVGMTRAHIADPHIAAQGRTEGREHEIRPCVGATYCIDRIYEGDEALCIHNAATGREATMPHVIARGGRSAPKVVVVGAGPAGLEAARVAAARGHAVIAVRGGRPSRAARSGSPAAQPRRRELIGIVDWRVAALRARLASRCSSTPTPKPPTCCAESPTS